MCACPRRATGRRPEARHAQLVLLVDARAHTNAGDDRRLLHFGCAQPHVSVRMRPQGHETDFAHVRERHEIETCCLRANAPQRVACVPCESHASLHLPSRIEPDYLHFICIQEAGGREAQVVLDYPGCIWQARLEGYL